MITKSRKLDTFIYSIGYYDSSILLPETQFGRLKFLSKLGFKTNDNAILSNSLEDTINIYKSFEIQTHRIQFAASATGVSVEVAVDFSEVLSQTG